MLKKSLALLLGLALAFTAGEALAARKTVIKVACYHAQSHPVVKALEKFKADMETRAGNDVEVQVFPNSQLGGEERTLELVERGAIQVGVVGSLFKKDEPTLALVDAPFAIDTWEQAIAVRDNKELWKQMVGSYTEKTGVNLFGVLVNGFRVVSSNKPVKNMDDFKTVKLRMPNTDVFVRMFQALGVNTVMMPMGEIYNALETGVVDGQEVPYPLVVAAGFWEEQKYCLETHHMFSYNSVIVNKKSYDALTPEVREAFDACMKEAIDYNWEISREDDDQSRQFLIDKGLEVTVPSPEFRQQMKDAMVPFFDWYFGEFPELKSVYKAMADTK